MAKIFSTRSSLEESYRKLLKRFKIVIIIAAIPWSLIAFAIYKLLVE